MITFVSLIGITKAMAEPSEPEVWAFCIDHGYQMGYRDMIWATVIIILFEFIAF